MLTGRHPIRIDNTSIAHRSYQFSVSLGSIWELANDAIGTIDSGAMNYRELSNKVTQFRGRRSHFTDPNGVGGGSLTAPEIRQRMVADSPTHYPDSATVVSDLQALDAQLGALWSSMRPLIEGREAQPGGALTIDPNTEQSIDPPWTAAELATVRAELVTLQGLIDITSAD